MRQIQSYDAKKYADSSYVKVEEGIYQVERKHKVFYVTSLSFIQEPELEEGDNAGYISQYPLEDLLDEFYCQVSDFYEELNTEASEVCYLEFASPDLEDVQDLRSIIGRHVYNKDLIGYIKLMIE